jgi:uncharacterized YkwD family protein
MKGNKFLLFIASLLLVLLVACNNNDNNNGLDDNDKDPNETAQNMNNEFGDDDDSISSDFTNITSDKYPHTKPILIQQAKYRFYAVGPGEEGRQMDIPLQPGVDLNKIPNNIQQQLQDKLNQMAPAEPQPRATQPTPQPKAEAPAPQPKAQEPAPKAPTPQQKAPAPQPKAQQPAPQQKAPAPQTTGISETERRVIELTNAERRKNGLPDLQADANLSKVAREKSNDMQQKNYFSHTSPTYGSPFDMMRDFGVTYKSAGENIAHGQPTPEQVVQAWMNSEGHRKNILSKNFTHIGVGFDSQGNYWTQMFIGK